MKNRTEWISWYRPMIRFDSFVQELSVIAQPIEVHWQIITCDQSIVPTVNKILSILRIEHKDCWVTPVPR